MRQFQKATLFMSLAALMLTSCSEEMPWSASGEEGTVTLNFSTDGRVMRQTRADDTLSPVVPDGSMFKIDFTKSDNTYSKQWSNVEGFNREKSFSMGDYTLTATYGDLNQEGFDNPYYKGTAEVHVSPGANSEANVVATLANAMVSIRYTDEFKENFKAYSAAVQTEGHDWVMFAQTETRPAYIAPGKGVKLNLTLTDDSDRIVTVQPAGFDAVARHHYVVTIGVKDNPVYGYSTLDIQFDEDVISETVAVPLGDELFTAPAPTITAQDFTVDTPITKFEYDELNVEPEFHVFAFGGFKSASLNIISENGYTPIFGKTVELVGADALTAQQLETEGIGGYFRNVDKMAVVNVKKFLEKLPAGTYEIELQAVDAMTRAAEPVKLKAVITDLKISLTAAGSSEFMGSEVAVDLTTNSPDIKDAVAFKVPDANNRIVNAEILSVTDVTASSASTRADGMYTFRYVLALQPSYHSEIEVEVHMKANLSKSAVTVVPVGEPEYTITPDAFSNYVVLKIDAPRKEVVKTLIDKLQFYNNETAIPSSKIAYDSNNATITIEGLAPSVKYLSLKAVCNTFEKVVPEFTTESQAEVPNGDFSLTVQTINMSGVQVGGTYTGTALSNPKYHWSSSIEVNEPTGWASVNQYTCYSGATNINTWFCVPSTLATNGAVTLRNVGYSHNGTTPGNYAKTAVYYCANTPTFGDSEKKAGELFLGSYAYNGSETRIEGVAFESRPSYMTFDYTYSALGSDKALAEIEILDSNDKVLASKTVALNHVTVTTTAKLELNGYAFGDKAGKLRIKFKSSNMDVPPINIPSGDSLKEKSGVQLGNNSVDANSYHALATGSVLTIDNVKLGYEAPSVSSAASKRRR